MLTDRLPQNSGNMPLLLVSVGVMATTVCIVTILQSFCYYLMTLNSGQLFALLKMSKTRRVKLALVIDYGAILFYLTGMFFTQIFIPIYISSAIEK